MPQVTIMSINIIIINNNKLCLLFMAKMQFICINNSFVNGFFILELLLFFIIIFFFVCVLSPKLHIYIGEGLQIFGSYCQDRTLHYFLLYYLVNININMDWVGLSLVTKIYFFFFHLPLTHDKINSLINFAIFILKKPA